MLIFHFHLIYLSLMIIIFLHFSVDIYWAIISLIYHIFHFHWFSLIPLMIHYWQLYYWWCCYAIVAFHIFIAISYYYCYIYWFLYIHWCFIWLFILLITLLYLLAILMLIYYLYWFYFHCLLLFTLISCRLMIFITPCYHYISLGWCLMPLHDWYHWSADTLMPLITLYFHICAAFAIFFIFWYMLAAILIAVISFRHTLVTDIEMPCHLLIFAITPLTSWYCFSRIIFIYA